MSNDVIITKLCERRRIEADLRGMCTDGSLADMRQQALEIASQGSQVIPAIVGNLREADGEMVVAMGTVATFLERDEIVSALRRAVRHPEQSARGRWAATTILERFLGEPLTPELTIDLGDAEKVTPASLEYVLSRAEKQPSILVEFIQVLDQQEPDVVLAVVHALRDRAATQPIQLLRMMAQDVREEIAEDALRVLGAIRTPQAASALQSLIPTSAPALRPLVERLLRKQMFAGVEVEASEAPQPEWRALVSPIDGRGLQSVWFLQEGAGAPGVRFLNVLLSDGAGAAEAIGHVRVSALALPPRRQKGALHEIVLPGSSQVLLMLEASFDLGRRLVLEGLEINRETQIPVAGSLRLYGPWLWGYGGADSLPPRKLPSPGSMEGFSSLDAGSLLGHPAFLTWTMPTAAMHNGVARGLHNPAWNEDRWIGKLTSTLFSGLEATQTVSRRLESMSEWLLLAGEEALSCLALKAAREILAGGASEHPFVRALVRRELYLAKNP